MEKTRHRRLMGRNFDQIKALGVVNQEPVKILSKKEIADIEASLTPPKKQNKYQWRIGNSSYDN